MPCIGSAAARAARVALALAYIALSLLVLTSVAVADDGPPFHRTTPRGAFGALDDALIIGVPGGRAWGIESDLRPLPAAGTRVIVRLAVTDASVREAFVRVAYYAVPMGRSRQLAIADSAPVSAGARMSVAVPIEAPPGAVAYRVRVLARLLDATGRSADDAVTAVFHVASGLAQPFGSFSSRLLD